MANETSQEANTSAPAVAVPQQVKASIWGRIEMAVLHAMSDASRRVEAAITAKPGTLRELIQHEVARVDAQAAAVAAHADGLRAKLASQVPHVAALLDAPIEEARALFADMGHFLLADPLPAPTPPAPAPVEAPAQGT